MLRHFPKVLMPTGVAGTLWWGGSAAWQVQTPAGSPVGAVSSGLAYLCVVYVAIAAMSHVLLRRATRRGRASRTFIGLHAVVSGAFLAVAIVAEIWAYRTVNAPYIPAGRIVAELNAQLEMLLATHWRASQTSALAGVLAMTAQLLFLAFAAYAALRPWGRPADRAS
jgi:hypothetical protein